eukprot:CAMPEP_0172807360 /NCGR_PEP_ID=MMETSP1075-20121228/6948_1 /TAXON_ID=2916 /ORGANISM="Ceratium fusus, Strain PA161109" /LENGTH=167 /DNA_ID=CAMNT_0013646329 /DNA_START=110 /DNA_END=614 /DNA_ORIENTATION=+
MLKFAPWSATAVAALVAQQQQQWQKSAAVAAVLPQYAEGGREAPREERFWEVLRGRGLAARDKFGWRLVPLWSVHVGFQGGSPFRSVSQMLASAPCTGQVRTGVATRSWAQWLKLRCRETGLGTAVASLMGTAGVVAALRMFGLADPVLLLGTADLKSGTAFAGLTP